MTEGEWLACTDPPSMLEFLGEGITSRKARLLACACCQEVWHSIPDGGCVEVVELLADGLASEEAVEQAHQDAHDAAKEAEREAQDDADCNHIASAAEAVLDLFGLHCGLHTLGFSLGNAATATGWIAFSAAHERADAAEAAASTQEEGEAAAMDVVETAPRRRGTPRVPGKPFSSAT